MTSLNSLLAKIWDITIMYIFIGQLNDEKLTAAYGLAISYYSFTHVTFNTAIFDNIGIKCSVAIGAKDYT